tara:strand:+ start:8473 stop:8700 length:228 start_codon:yes stop_codon:yes gene_type:complete
MAHNHNLILTTEQLKMVQRMAQEYVVDLRDDLETLEHVADLKKTPHTLSRALDTAQSVLNECKQTLEDPSNEGHI